MAETSEPVQLVGREVAEMRAVSESETDTAGVGALHFTMLPRARSHCLIPVNLPGARSYDAPSMQIDPTKERGSVSVFGRVSPESATDVMLAALTAARARRLRTVLFAFERLALSRELSILEAHAVAERLAHAGRGLLRAAFVIREECAAIGAHMATTAANRGLEAAVFRREADAVAWLDAAS